MKWFPATVLAFIVLFVAGAGPAGAAVMVPLRPVLEYRGTTVGWDGEGATAYCSGRVLRVVPGRDTAAVDGRGEFLEVPARSVGGMTFVPDTLLSGFLSPPPPAFRSAAFTRVVVGEQGEQFWFIGLLDPLAETAVTDSPPAPTAPGPTVTPPHGRMPEVAVEVAPGVAPEELNPENPVLPGRTWLLPAAGADRVLEGLISLMEAELDPGGLSGLTVAPGAVAVLREALASGLNSVTLPLERRIGSCLVNFNPGGENHNNMLNAVQAAAYLNGITIAPGQVFSYNQTVGPRSAERGFVIGYAISGDRHVPARGGGVCRTSTVLYGAVLNAGLTVIERHAHSKPVGYVPVGRDAAVSYGAADFKFRNQLPHPVRIEAGGTVRQLQVTLWELRG
jgi:hypothetical protein